MRDAIVVGAGQAGLSASYSLRELGLDHVVLERGRIGESWRSQRWDSFAVNTPNAFNALPGAPYEGVRPDGFYSRDDLVDAFARYSRRFDLPVREGVRVTAVEPAPGGFRILARAEGREERLATRAVVVAAGGLNKPKTPAFARELPERIAQLHAGTYRNPDALPPGAVVVVGSGQSGVQIAEDLLEAGRRVYLCASRVRRIPRRYRGRDIFAWLAETGFLDVERASLEDPSVARLTQPQISGVGRYGHTVSLQQLARDGVRLLGGVEAVEGSTLLLRRNLAECLRYADKASAEVKKKLDGYIAKTGIQAPEPEDDPADRPWDGSPIEDPETLDLDRAGVGTVVWCTGFTGDFSWLPAACRTASGEPRHEGGVSPVDGIYYLGLAWLRKRKSGLIPGAAEDAALIARKVAEKVAQPTPPNV